MTNETSSIPGALPAYHLSTYLLQIPHISLSCTVCDREIVCGIHKEFSKDIQHNERECVRDLSGLEQSQRSTDIPLISPASGPRYARWDVSLNTIVEYSTIC